MKQRLTIIGIWVNRLLIYPHPRQLLRSNLSSDDREAVATYIENCSHENFVTCPPFLEEDCLLSAHKRFEFDLRSDGRWLFPVSLAHYVRQGVSLPEGFVDHVRSAQSAPVCEPVRQDEPAINEMYWMIWSLTHSWWNSYFVLHIIRLASWFPIYLLFYFYRRYFRRRIW